MRTAVQICRARRTHQILANVRLLPESAPKYMLLPYYQPKLSMKQNLFHYPPFIGHMVPIYLSGKSYYTTLDDGCITQSYEP